MLFPPLRKTPAPNSDIAGAGPYPPAGSVPAISLVRPPPSLRPNLSGVGGAFRGEGTAGPFPPPHYQLETQSLPCSGLSSPTPKGSEMARRPRSGSSRKAIYNKRSAISRPIARPRLLPLASLPNFEDARRWHPSQRLRPQPLPRSFTTTTRTARRLSVGSHLSRLRFAVPRSVHLCVKRKQRKEIMHALQKAGKKGVGRSKKRRNQWSDVKC